MEQEEILNAEQLAQFLKEIIAAESQVPEGDEVFARVSEYAALVDSAKNRPLRFGSFTAVISDEYHVVVSADYGWSITYPKGSDSWMILSRWIIEGEEESISSFIKLIVFPTSIRLADIDEEYMNTIVMAHKEQSDRSAKLRAEDNEQDA